MKCSCGETLSAGDYDHMARCEAFRRECADEIHRLFHGSYASSNQWNKRRRKCLPMAPKLYRMFDSWDGFLRWTGTIKQYAAYHCYCGLHTSSPKIYGEHARTCYVFRQQMVDELERLVGEVGSELTMRQWDELTAKRFPKHRVILKVWRSWAHFLAELYQREDAKMNRREDGYENIALPVSSVREDAHRVYYMLR